MQQAIFDELSRIAYERAGIHLNQNKRTLVAARIGKRMRALGLEQPRQYLRRLKDDDGGDELIQFLDAISTNYTHFFRERDHFDILEREVESWLARGRKRIRIWCAASSSGEEPYSIAMTILDVLNGRPLDFRILATDISTRILAVACEGRYPGERLSHLDGARRLAYFDECGRGRHGSICFEAKPQLKQCIVFKRLNLAKPPFPMKGPLDAVLCRNVMIYFDKRVRQNLVTEIERLLHPGALLMIGHSETLTGIETGLLPLKPSVYRKSESSTSNME